MCVVCFVFVVMSLFLFRTLSFDCEPDTLEKGNEDDQEDFGSFTSEFDTWKVESNSSFVSCESQFLDFDFFSDCLLYTSPSPRDGLLSRMPSSA